jgi:UDP-GlcNAc:undecaprenyl-phosphate GlcNAc-1-phosphate transferase
VTTEWILALFAGFVLTVAGTPLAAMVAWRVNAIDYPAARKIHGRPTPRLGGLAILASLIVVVVGLLKGDVWRQALAIVGAGGLVATAGFLDDMGRVHSQVKLVCAMPLAGLILLTAGIRANVTTSEWLNSAITIAWVVGVSAAFNLLDGMDGLAAGVTAIAACWFVVLASLDGQRLVGLLGAVVLGVSVGFLVYNWHPARVFMGDGGATFLGFMMATLGLKLRVAEVPEPVRWLVPVLVLGVPIFDTMLVIVSRLRRGLVPFASPGKDHTFHRLRELGWDQRRVIWRFYCVSACLGAVAVGLVTLRASQVVWVAAAVVLGVIGVVGMAWFERLPFERQRGITWGAMWKKVRGVGRTARGSVNEE